MFFKLLSFFLTASKSKSFLKKSTDKKSTTDSKPVSKVKPRKDVCIKYNIV